MEWLTDHKIPVGKTAKSVFDWLQHHGSWFFDGLADWGEKLIDAILWLLQMYFHLVLSSLTFLVLYRV